MMPRRVSFKMVAQRSHCANLPLAGMCSRDSEILYTVCWCTYRLINTLHRYRPLWITIPLVQEWLIWSRSWISTHQIYATPQVVSCLLTTALSARGVSKAALNFDSVHHVMVPHYTYEQELVQTDYCK